MNSEALRLLSTLNEAVGQYAEAIRNDKRNGMTGAAAAKVDSCVDQLRALLSAQEEHPKPEHWMQAHVEDFVDTRTTDAWRYARDLYRRARELAKQEAK